MRRVLSIIFKETDMNRKFTFFVLAILASVMLLPQQETLAADNVSFIKNIQPYSVRMVLSEMVRQPSAEAFGAAEGDCEGRAELCAFIDVSRRYGLTHVLDYAVSGSAISAEVMATLSDGGQTGAVYSTVGNTIGIEAPKFWSDIELSMYRHSYGRNDAAFAIALLDVIDRLPANHYRRPQLISQLSTLLSSAKTFADPTSGLWRTSSTSGDLDATTSAMMLYAIMKSVNRRYLPDDWRDYATELYKKYLRTFVEENDDGTISLKSCHEVGFCPFGHSHSAGAGQEYKDGHGAVAAFIRASMEYEAANNVFYSYDGKYVENGKPVTEKISKEVAFKGAEGCGKWTKGGKGGKVIKVTSLEDNSEPGSLRYALEAEGPRIVEFSVSGEIHLKEPIKVVNPYISILGQTAPGQGITVMDQGIYIEADEVIIRYMRFRMGETAGGSGSAVECRRSENVIIDHCSISWGVNVNLTLSAVSKATVSWCIISESLNCQSGECGYGAILGGRDVSIHHNLFVSNNMGSPRFDHPAMYSGDDILYRRGTVEFVDNVIYNWGEKALWGGEEGWFNVLLNWFRAGVGTKASDGRYIDIAAAAENSKIQGSFYIYGNVIDCNYVHENGNYQGRKPDGKRVALLSELYGKLSKPMMFRIADLTPIQNTEKMFNSVLGDAGASKSYDATDKRILKEVHKEELTYKGSVTGIPGIIDSVNDLKTE